MDDHFFVFVVTISSIIIGYAIVLAVVLLVACVYLNWKHHHDYKVLLKSIEPGGVFRLDAVHNNPFNNDTHDDLVVIEKKANRDGTIYIKYRRWGLEERVQTLKELLKDYTYIPKNRNRMKQKIKSLWSLICSDRACSAVFLVLAGYYLMALILDAVTRENLMMFLTSSLVSVYAWEAYKYRKAFGALPEDKEEEQ